MLKDQKLYGQELREETRISTVCNMNNNFQFYAKYRFKIDFSCKYVSCSVTCTDSTNDI